MRDLPVQVLARMRSDRVLRRAVPPRAPGTNGRPPRHGGEFIFGDPNSWGRPDVTTVTDTRLYGQAVARSWDRLHPRLTRRAGWMGSADLPLIEGTVMRLARHLAADLRRPWEKPTRPERLSPARVRRGFRHLRGKTPCPANAPKPCQPGPGRPPGRRNTKPTPRHHVHIMTTATSTKTNTNKPTKKKSINPRPRRTG